MRKMSDHPNHRQVLECASPLALWAVTRITKAVEGRRRPRRCRADGAVEFVRNRHWLPAAIKK